MFEAFTKAVELVRAELAGLDAEALGGQEASELLRVCAELSVLAQAGATLAAGRVARTEAYRASRSKTAHGYVSRICGISVSAAEAMIDLADRLERFPATAALLKEGEISPAEADAVTRAASRNAAAEQSLLDTARRESFSRLKDRCNATQSPDPDDDRRRAEAARAARSVRTWTDADGVGHLHAKGPVDLIGLLAGRIANRADDYFVAARSSEDHQPAGAYRFDALVDLICGIPPDVSAVPADECGRGDTGRSSDDADEHDGVLGFDVDEDVPLPDVRPPPRSRSSTPKVDMLIRIDFGAMRRGWVEGDEICEIAGIGPLPVEAAREYLSEAALKFILTDAKDIRAVSHLGRHVGSRLRSALYWRYRTCSNPDCDRTLGLERDHQLPFGKGGWTALENLQLLCRSCHDEKTRRDYPNGTAHLRRRRTESPAA